MRRGYNEHVMEPWTLDAYAQYGSRHPHSEIHEPRERSHSLASAYNSIFPMRAAETNDLFAETQTRLYTICEAQVETLNVLRRAET